MAAGSIAKITGSGQAIPGLTTAVIDVGTIDTDPDNILTEVSAGRYRPDAEGYYLIVASGRFDETHNNRVNIKWEIERNSTAVAGTGGTGYARNNANPYAYMRAGAILHFNGTSDYFEVFHNRDSGAGTPAGSYNNTRCKVVHLATGAASATPYGRYGTPTSGAFTGSTPTAIAGWDVITESDTATIELQAGGTAIRLKEADRPYLIVYGLENSDAGGSRTQRVSDVTLAGTRVAHSGGYAYQRDSSNQEAVPFGMALVRPGTANQDLNVRCWGLTPTTFWGTFDSGTWTLSSAAGDAGVMVIALPATTDIAIFEDTTGGQTVSGAADVTLNAANAAAGTVDSPFTRDSATDVTVSSATEVLAYSSYMVERTATSGVRNTSATRWVKEGVELTAATEYGSYLRGDQSTQDTPNMVFGSLFVDTTAANDTFVLEKFDPGTDDGANDETLFGGSFYIDLATLAAGSPPVVETVDTTVTATTSVVDALTVLEAVDTTITATTSTADVATYAETVDTTITATTSTVDAIAAVFTMSASANITPGGEPSTAQLDPPAGKTTGDFFAGGRWDDENGTDSFNPTADSYTEHEWWIEATGAAVDGGQYEFRIVFDGNPPQLVSAAPKWTIGTGSASETVDTTINATTTTVDAATYVETVDTTIAATTSTLDVANRTETVDTLITCTTETTDTAATVEVVDTVISASTDTDDLAGLVDTVDTLINATTSIEDIATTGETVDTLITCTTSTVDVHTDQSETADTVINGTTSTVDLTSGGETVDTTVTATTSTTDLQTGRTDTVDTVVNATTTTTDLQSGRTDTVDTLITCTTSTVDTHTGQAETVSTVINATTSGDDLISGGETVDTTITATTSTTDLATYVETVDTTVNATTSTADLHQGRSETVDTTINATTTTTDTTTTGEVVDTVIATTTSTADAETYVETVDTVIAAATDTADAATVGETVDTVITCTTTTIDLAIYNGEDVETLATVTTTVVDLSTSTEVVETLITCVTSILDIGSADGVSAFDVLAVWRRVRVEDVERRTTAAAANRRTLVRDVERRDDVIAIERRTRTGR